MYVTKNDAPNSSSCRAWLTKEEGQSCLKNRDWLFVGDSHLREYFVEVINILDDRPRDSTLFVPTYTVRVIDSINTSLTFFWAGMYREFPANITYERIFVNYGGFWNLLYDLIGRTKIAGSIDGTSF